MGTAYAQKLFERRGENMIMGKLRELTIKDLKELTDGKRVSVSSTENSAMSVYIKDAVIIADPEVGTDGKIVFYEPESGHNIELDSDKAIEAIYGNENEIMITFTNNMGSMDISIIGGIGTETDHVINQDELCQYIKDRLDKLSKLKEEDIDLVLNMEMEYLQSKGIVD